ncbi:MAG: tRNA (adenosine(37)-N6)-threonylcarbamoyltransferase complex ATPase subunit type 1 TsaE, partial [Gammaproteobacteria bacterium]
ADAGATERLGADLAGVLRGQPGPWLIALEGALGAGKTTMARGFLRALGHTGRVPSPTYTLVEPYEISGHEVLHLDLYRLADAAELEYLGIRDVFGGNATVLVEWPERAGERLPPADIRVSLHVTGEGRAATLSADTVRGAEILAALASSHQDATQVN